MRLSFDQLALIEPRARSIEEAPIQNSNADTSDGAIGWHSTIIGSNGSALGSGCHTDRNIARRVAIAETIERALYARILDDSTLSTEFQLKEFPSSCGFAAGFEALSTRRRSIAEAVERWAWSKWIDARQAIFPEQVPQHRLTPLSERLLVKFDSHQTFVTNLKLQEAHQNPQEFKFTAVIAFKDGGAFPGSRVSAAHEVSNESSAIEHAVVEAWRHWTIFKGLPSVAPSDLVYGRIHHFGKNAQLAQNAIPQTSPGEWPQPVLRLIKSMAVDLGHGLKVYLSRALCADYVGWHEGDSRRFVY
ncbi:hypothetical protein EBZ37_07535 [bacterium]|nr:hypothetical protein [bacterium]